MQKYAKQIDGLRDAVSHIFEMIPIIFLKKRDGLCQTLLSLVHELLLTS